MVIVEDKGIPDASFFILPLMRASNVLGNCHESAYRANDGIWSLEFCVQNIMDTRRCVAEEKKGGSVDNPMLLAHLI
jgi:hypothetical protein